MRPLPLLFLLVLVGCPGFSAAKDEFPPGLPHGEFTLPTDAPWFDSTDKPGARFDFSTATWVFEPNDPIEGDIAFYSTFLVGSGRLNVGLQDTMPQSLNNDKTAPSDGYDVAPKDSTKDVKMPIYSSHVYWIRTKEGHFAKIKIEGAELNAGGDGYDRMVIKWVYQPDGTQDFTGKQEAEVLEQGRDLGEKHGLDTSGGLDLSGGGVD